MIVLTNCCREPHSSYLIWGKCLGSVGCWPGATIDRLLVVFQGEAGGGRPAERTEGPAGGRAVFHGNSHKQLSLHGVYFLASISYPWYEMNWFSHCPPARPFTRRRSVSWRTSVMRRTNWSKKHSSDWQNMRRRGNCSLVCSHDFIPSPDTITRDTAAPAWPVICFKQHRKPKKDKKMKPKDNDWIQCKSRTCKEKIYWYTNNRPLAPPRAGIPWQTSWRPVWPRRTPSSWLAPSRRSSTPTWRRRRSWRSWRSKTWWRDTNRSSATRRPPSARWDQKWILWFQNRKSWAKMRGFFLFVSKEIRLNFLVNIQHYSPKGTVIVLAVEQMG